MNSEYLQLGDLPVFEVAHRIFGCFLFAIEYSRGFYKKLKTSIFSALKSLENLLICGVCGMFLGIKAVA